METVFGFGSYLLPFLFVLTILVFIHEFGHYWVARRNGVRVETFSIGFGPELFGFKDKAGTRWRFSAIPLGGYVKMFGDADAASRPNGAVDTMSPEDRAVSFHHKRVGQRAAIIFAGPLANFLFAIAVLTVLLSTSPHPIPPPVVGTVMSGSAAEEAGLKPGDKIIEANGEAIGRFFDLARIVQGGQGAAVNLVVKRDGDPLSFQATPRPTVQTTPDGQEVTVYLIGLRADEGPYPVHQAAVLAVTETWDLTWLSLKSIGEMFVGKRGVEDLGGPIRIAEMSGDAARSGVAQLFWFIAFLSISLGLMNLFPIPMLDGGHLLFYAFEAVRGRPLTRKAQEYGFRVGFALVLTLVIFVLWNDLAHLQIVDRIGN